MLRQAWENEVKLIDVESSAFMSHPWSHVMAHPTEDAYIEDEFQDCAKLYLNNQINERFCLSLFEWMSLPLFRKQQLMKIAADYGADKLRASEQIRRDLDRGMRS